MGVGCGSIIRVQEWRHAAGQRFIGTTNHFLPRATIVTLHYIKSTKNAPWCVLSHPSITQERDRQCSVVLGQLPFLDFGRVIRRSW